MMRSSIGMALVALVSSTAAVRAADQTWTGTLIDTKCYSIDMKNNAGKDHILQSRAIANCAAACAKMGIPVALLVNGKVMTLAAPAPSFADYMAKTAVVTGSIQGDLIVPTKVIVDGKELNVSGMM
jgi:hypothetical protein